MTHYVGKNKTATDNKPVIVIGSIYNAISVTLQYKKLSYCWETVQRESMLRIAEMDVEMTT